VKMLMADIFLPAFENLATAEILFNFSLLASTVDSGMTGVVDVDLLIVMTGYENGWGFTNQMIRQILGTRGETRIF